MLCRLVALVALAALGTPAMAETHANKAGTFAFTTPDGWENTEDGDRFSIMSPDADAMLTELDLKQQSATETLQETNERVTWFHHKSFGGKPSAPREVKGNGWTGVLQGQETASGGYEFQLVAKTSARVLVFYLAAPIPGLTPDLEQLEEIILSLSISTPQ